MIFLFILFIKKINIRLRLIKIKINNEKLIYFNLNYKHILHSYNHESNRKNKEFMAKKNRKININYKSV